MNLEKLSSSEVKSQIAVTTSRIEMCKHSVKLWTGRKDIDTFNVKCKEQQVIITEANAEIDRLGNEFNMADEKIAFNEASIRYEETQLSLLQNRSAILKLLKIQEELKGIA